MRYWFSFVQPTEDYRPLTYPPNEAILGWWCSGYTGDGGATICVLAEAKDEHDLWDKILSDWPEAEDVRFCKPVENDWIPPSGRFPLSDWSEERVLDKSVI